MSTQSCVSCKNCDLRTQRIFTTFLNSDLGASSLASVAAVSSDGRYVLYSFSNFLEQTPTFDTVTGAVFSSNCGQLQLVDRFKVLQGFDSGLVVTNSAFRTIYLLEEVTTPDILTQLQIRAYNFNNGTITLSHTATLSRSILNQLTAGGTVIAALTPDCRYLVIGYNTTADFTVSKGDATLTVVDAQTLAEVGTTTFATGTSTQAVVISGMINSFGLVSKCGRRITDYVALSTGLGTIVPPNNFVEGISGPFTVKVFNVTGQPVLVDSVNTPQFVNTSTGFQPACAFLQKTLILTTARAAILPTDHTLARNPSGSLSAIPGDNRNLRIYKFNGKRLKLLVAEKFEWGISGSTFAPDGRTFMVATTEGTPLNIPSQIGDAQIYRICERAVNLNLKAGQQQKKTKKCYTIEPLGKLTAAAPTAASPFFSPDGHFVYEGFAAFDVKQSDSTLPGFNNISVLLLSDCIESPFPECKALCNTFNPLLPSANQCARRIKQLYPEFNQCLLQTNQCGLPPNQHGANIQPVNLINNQCGCNFNRI
jgi:hypothetical protein